MTKKEIFEVLKGNEVLLSEAQKWFKNAEKFAKGGKDCECQLLKAKNKEELEKMLISKIMDAGLEGVLRNAIRALQEGKVAPQEIWDDLQSKGSKLIRKEQLKHEQKILEQELKDSYLG